MNKQTKYPSLFDQALAIAIDEGKIESSKEAAPFQSGIVGENYLLFSKQRKLIKSIPLEKLKRNTRIVRNTNKAQGCFANSLVVTAILAFLSMLALPKFEGISEKAKSAAARNTIATMAKSCAVKIADAGTGTIIVPEIQGYKSKKKNIAGFYLGNNRKISGTSIVCPTTGEIKLISENEWKHPSYSYNFETGKKTCIADSGSYAEQWGCLNGEW
ncbi:type II secretion system protein [Prochlorococcus marinus]|uniref:Uncharacterized protein n=1 Tax=Prochlorococcus marinus XMU1408 TaxID=2213228 RepID=A0A318QX15_PROMR|nr:hypothetical protein [Prochlorococcus marinus]PYE01085.1 hypothetical protein DNJ73_06530 [Prochlorococcus marinus XMU1408]